MPYDVFLSYSSANKAWVERLAWRLRSYRLDVWFDGWCIKPGDQIVDQINRGLADSGSVISVYSQASLKSGWVGLESAAALEAAIHGKRLIPVKLEECDIPPLQGALRTVDFTAAGNDDTFERRVRELLRAFPGRLAELLREPLGIPLVVASMTAQEVEALFDGSAFVNHEDSWRQCFASFSDAVGHWMEPIPGLTAAEAVKTHVTGRYGKDREDWRPYGGPSTIRDLLSAHVDRFNDALDLALAEPVALEHWSGEFFAEETNLRTRTAYRLSQRGCYLLIDPLALLHPRVAQILLASQLLTSESVTILCPSPLDSRQVGIFRFVEQAAREFLDPLFFRFERLDPQCVLGIEDYRTFELLLKTQLSLAVERLKRLVPSRARVQMLRAEVQPTSQVGSLIVGGAVHP